MVHLPHLRGWKKHRLMLIAIAALLATGVSTFLFIGTIREEANAVALVKTESIATPRATEVTAPLRTLPSTESSTPEEDRPLITTYTVQSGDTLSSIAKSFSVSVNTIRWANDLSVKSTLKVGQELAILPFNGVKYVVKKGDTVSGIASRYHGEQKEIVSINGLESEKDIKPGDTLFIPDGEMPLQEPVKAVVKTTPKQTTKPLEHASGVQEAKTPSTLSETTPEKGEEKESAPQETGKVFVNPIPGSVLTQGIHDGSAVDFGAPIGTSVRAAASGTVIIAKNGYNGGYGNYIVITHPKGSQTLYAHLSKIEVSVGEEVEQGKEIAKSGNSGKSTGAHLHFKTIGAINPFGKNKKGTRY